MLASISFGSIFYYLADNVKVTGDENLFRNFFDKGGFIWGFVFAISIALIIAALYYYGCHRSFRLAKLYVWIIVLLLSGTAGYRATFYYARTSLMSSLEAIDKKNRDTIQFLDSDTDKADTLKRAEVFKQKWTSKIEKEPNDKITIFAWTNTVWTMLFFLVFSLLFKNFTCYGKAVPWGKSRKNRNKK